MINHKNRWGIHFYSDPHFGHDNVIKFCNRPYKDLEEMTATFIKKYNRVVKPNDLVIWVGDCFFYYTQQQALDLMGKLNGRKILVRGNHDLKNKQMMNMGFDFCTDELVYEIAGERVTVSHYPFLPSFWENVKWHCFYKWRMKLRGQKTHELRYKERRPKNYGQFLIHGHTHNKDRVKGRMIHAGVDAWGDTPVNLNKMAQIITDIKECEKKGIKYEELEPTRNKTKREKKK